MLRRSAPWLALAALLSSVPVSAIEESLAPPHDHAPHDLMDSGVTNKRFVPPPPGLVETALGRKVAPITVNYNPSTCPGTTTAWPAEARTAFSYAASIWAAILNGEQTIEVDACYRTDLPANVLGRTGAETFYRNFDNAPQANTFYPVALANEIAGSDLNGSGRSEIVASFSNAFDWYYGLDGAVPDTVSDFVTVVIHELGHGLGFTGSVRYDDGVAPAECGGTANTACYGLNANNDPAIYDRFTEDLNGNGILSYTSGTTALGNVVTSDDVFFDGTAANFFNGGQRVELFAPAVWNVGSSYAHLAEAYNNTEHALMTFSLDRGEAVHYPGRITLGLFQDMGWDIRSLTSVVVDGSYTGSVETGSPGNPFDTVNEGVKAVYPGGTVTIRNGNYREDVIVIRPMILRAEGTGSSVIGN